MCVRAHTHIQVGEAIVSVKAVSITEHMSAKI